MYVSLFFGSSFLLLMITSGWVCRWSSTEVCLFLMTYRKRSYKFRDWPGIVNDATTSRRGEEWSANRDVRLSPESIAKVGSYNHVLPTPSLPRFS
jgi:hypothetical protein